MTICPKCGAPGFKGLCPSCAPNPFIEKLKDLKLVFCHKSHTVKLGHKWFPAKSIEEAITMLVDHKINAKKDVELEVGLVGEDHIPIGPGVDRNCILQIHAIKGGEEQVFQVPINIFITISPKYSKEGTRYFEGVLQVRNYRPKDHKHVMDFIKRELKKLEEKGGFVNKEVHKKFGSDFFVTKQNLIPSMARKVVNEFGGEVTLTSKLFTQDHNTSKEVHRGSILLELPDYVKGDIVEVNKELHVVQSSKAKFFTCIKLKDFSRVKYETSRHKYEIVAHKDAVKKTKVSMVSPHVEVLHPETFQSTPVKNSKLPKEFKSGENVSVLVHDGVWIVK